MPIHGPSKASGHLSAMVYAVIILAILAVLVATDPSESEPPRA